MVQRNHVDTEGDLQLRLGVEVVQHHLTHGVAFDLNHDAHAVFIGLITQGADALDAFVLHQLSNLLNQARFVHLIWNFVHDDGFATGFRVGFDFRARANVDLTAAGAIGLFNTATAIDDRRRREVWPRNMRHQPFNADVLIVNIGQAAVDHFRQVVWRNVGGHPYRDTGRAVNQQVRDFGRHDVRNAFGTVVVINEIDRLFLQIGHQLVGNFRHTDFRITHRRGGVAVYRAEVTLAINQHVTQRKRLRHTDDGVIHRRITVGMVFTDYVTNDTGRFFVGFIPVIAQYVHGV